MSNDENDKLDVLDIFSLNLREVQSSNIKLFFLSILFLLLAFYKSNNVLKNEMIKGLFIILFMQVLDYYTFKNKASFLKHEKYLLSLSSLVGEALYLVLIRPRIK